MNTTDSLPPLSPEHRPIRFEIRPNSLGYSAVEVGCTGRWVAHNSCPITASLRLAWSIWFGWSPKQPILAEWVFRTRIHAEPTGSHTLYWDDSAAPHFHLLRRLLTGAPTDPIPR